MGYHKKEDLEEKNLIEEDDSEDENLTEKENLEDRRNKEDAEIAEIVTETNYYHCHKTCVNYVTPCRSPDKCTQQKQENKPCLIKNIEPEAREGRVERSETEQKESVLENHQIFSGFSTEIEKGKQNLMDKK